MQRLELLRKGEHPDVLVMTATPIPRTLSLTVYGELDVSVIDELPPGRSPIITRARGYDAAEKVYSFIATEIRKGRQAYVVCPLVEESELKTAKAATETFEHLSKRVFPNLRVALLHGRMPPVEKAAAMDAFAAGDTQLLVCTTVIEVGVDVPNASLMVIEHAERFGLAQLHQLRGRVGRGARSSECVLLFQEPLSETARKRLKVIRETADGFAIAEQDLRLRGPGEFLGERQSGEVPLRFADLAEDEALSVQARDAAESLLAGDQGLVRRHIDRWLGARAEFDRV